MRGGRKLRLLAAVGALAAGVAPALAQATAAPPRAGTTTAKTGTVTSKTGTATTGTTTTGTQTTGITTTGTHTTTTGTQTTGITTTGTHTTTTGTQTTGTGTQTTTTPTTTTTPYRLAPPTPATVDIGATNPQVPAVPPGFVGLSLEYSALLPYTGTDPAQINPVLLQLIRNLAPDQSPVLRIGGDSTDWSWWPVRGMKQPLGIRYTITPKWLAATAALAKDLRARLILGINLEANSARLAVTEARALSTPLRRWLLALEIGNEPELYGTFPWYDPPGGPVVVGRPPTWAPAPYLAQFARFRAQMPAGAPIAGPSIGDYSWLTDLKQFLSANPRVTTVTVHRYALNRCVKKTTSPTYATISNLLTRFASQSLVTQIAPLVATARAFHAGVRVDEMGSVTCGGKLGVSNSFAAALWALDATFAQAHAGVTGVNFHTYPGGYNQLFAFNQQAGSWSAKVEPMYYGLMMFARAAPPGSRFLQIAGTHTDGFLRSWATRGRDGRTRVVLIDASQTESFKVTLSGATGTATLQRMTAPSARASSGIELGGQTFGPLTTTGRLVPPITQALKPAGGLYSLTLSPASAALVTLPAPRKSTGHKPTYPRPHD